MNNLFEMFAGIVFVCIILFLAVCLVSLPFAFLGWILLSAVAIFTPVIITYTASAVLGLAVFIVGAIIS